MAVKHKTGLDYFSFDVDFFSDEKVEFISARFGIKGEIITIKLLCRIYRNGYYTEWTDDDATMFAKRVGDVTPALVSDVVAELVRRDFFDKGIFNSFGILTSKGIQRRYLDAVERRKSVEVNKDYLLVDVEKYKNVNISAQNVYIKEENVNILRQSKVKESKGKESKETFVPAKPSPPKKPLIEKEKEKEPYWQELVQVWFEFNHEKFGDHPTFDDANPRHFKKILEKLKKRAAAKGAEWTIASAQKRLRAFLVSAYADAWLARHFLLKNLNEQFDVIVMDQKKKAEEKPGVKSEDLQFLFDMFREGKDIGKLILPDHFDQLQAEKLIHLDQRFLDEARVRRMKMLEGSNEGALIRLAGDYRDNRVTPATEKDLPNLLKIAKRLSLADHFLQLKDQGSDCVFDNLKKILKAV